MQTHERKSAETAKIERNKTLTAKGTKIRKEAILTALVFAQSVDFVCITYNLDGMQKNGK